MRRKHPTRESFKQYTAQFCVAGSEVRRYIYVNIYRERERDYWEVMKGLDVSSGRNSGRSATKRSGRGI